MHALVFVDTNVLLHYQFFDEVDWHVQLGVTGVTLVFAPVVLAELDHQKWSGTRREKSRAKSVLKRLLSLGLSPTPVSVRPSVDALALDAEPPDALFTQHRLHAQASDDRLLASLLAFRAEQPASRILILSADSGLHVKARSRQIEIAAPDDALGMPEEPDEVERELEKARRELNELKGAAPDLRLTFGDTKTYAAFDIRSVTSFDDSTLRQLVTAWQSTHPYIDGVPETITLLGGQTLSLKGLAGIPGLQSASDAAEHNAEIDRLRLKYEAFLTLWPAAVNQARRTLEFNLVLENGGTAPADDVDVQIWTDAAGTFREDLPDLPAPPVVPKRRSPYDSALDVGMPYLDHFATAIPDVGENVDGPNISGEGSDQRVQYDIKRVKHHVPCELPVVYFQFDSDEDVASFTMSIRLVAANIRKPQNGSLHVEVTRAAPAAPPFPSEPDDE